MHQSRPYFRSGSTELIAVVVALEEVPTMVYPGSMQVRLGTVYFNFHAKTKLLVVVLGRYSVEELVSVEIRFDGK